MNRKMKQTIFTLRGQLANYKHDVSAAVTDYNEKRAGVAEEAKKYKDEDTYFTTAMHPVRSITQSRVQTYQKTFIEALNTAADEMEAELSSSVLLLPGSTFNEALAFYRNFKLDPSKLEVQALAKMAGGSSLALRAINAMLKENGSRLKVEFSSPETLCNDIESLRKLTSNCLYIPLDPNIPNGLKLFIGEPKADYNTPVPAGKSDRFTQVDLLISAQRLNAFDSELERMEARWSAEIVPTVTQAIDSELYQDTEGEEGETVSVKQQFLKDYHDTSKAAEVVDDPDAPPAYLAGMIEQNRKNGETYKRALDHYKKGGSEA